MNETRKYWLDTMLKIVSPVLETLYCERLKRDMLIEAKRDKEIYQNYVYLEVFGRVLSGIAPWLAAEGLTEEEEKLRAEYAEKARKCIAVAVNPESEDCFNFSSVPQAQTIVDAAFLAQGLLRAKNVLWDPLDGVTKERLLNGMRDTRKVKPYENNWLLFSAMIECFMYEAGAEDWRAEPIDYALKKHMEWYKGDGWYGDGPNFHTDYYNSFVIQPMLVDIMLTVGDIKPEWQALKEKIFIRAARYATVQERMISPEGSYPLIGRSLCYRFGAFHALAQAAYLEKLENVITPAQVRCALTAVIKKICSFEDMFDQKGWLKIGVCGYQPYMGEEYISTASLYLCSTVFLPLGVGENHPFWSDEDKPWTQKRLWQGENLKCEHSLD